MEGVAMAVTPKRSRTMLRRTLKRYALRYYISGADQDALIEQTVSALAAEGQRIRLKLDGYKFLPYDENAL